MTYTVDFALTTKQHFRLFAQAAALSGVRRAPGGIAAGWMRCRFLPSGLLHSLGRCGYAAFAVRWCERSGLHPFGFRSAFSTGARCAGARASCPHLSGVAGGTLALQAPPLPAGSAPDPDR